LNNNDYAIISEEAGRRYDLEPEEYGWSEAPLEFPSIAEGMGVSATRCRSPEAIRGAVTDALATSSPSVVEIPVDPTEPQASEFMAE
jgi:acetolactate synthase-1/2/3 large subunit